MDRVCNGRAGEAALFRERPPGGMRTGFVWFHDFLSANRAAVFWRRARRLSDCFR